MLPPLSLTSLQSLAGETRARLATAPAEWERQTCLVLLQLVTGLKHMQAQGLEETCLDLTLAARGSKLEGHDPDHRLMIVPPAEHGEPRPRPSAASGLVALRLPALASASAASLLRLFPIVIFREKHCLSCMSP